MKFSDLPLHHATLFTHTDRIRYSASLWSELSQHSPAHRYFNQTVLDIETSRAIISFAQSPYNDEKIALISFNTASLPAQNALLKVLEEPRHGVRFILLTSNTNNLIPTILSRVLHVPFTDTSIVDQKDAELFLATPSVSRMKLPCVTDLLGRVDEEGRKDRESVKAFIMSLIPVLREHKADSRYIVETLEIASYASDPSASGKALLEYLALFLPSIK